MCQWIWSVCWNCWHQMDSFHRNSIVQGEALGFIQPEWPVPPHIKAIVTTRLGGSSSAPYDSLNLALHVGDRQSRVLTNRQRLYESLALSNEPPWLNQVHGVRVIRAEEKLERSADAVHTDKLELPCAVLIADCLPVFLCDRKGKKVAVLHAGWRGLAQGIVAATVARAFPQDDLIAWLGPAIGPCHYEVGVEVKNAFGSETDSFTPSRPGRWMFDLYAVARKQLAACGVQKVYGGEFCTYCEKERYNSYRRDGDTGRMAAIIWRC